MINLHELSFFSVECVHTYFAAPGALRGDLHGRVEAVHVISAVTVVAKQELVIILGGAAQAAGLTLDTLPVVLPHTHTHVGGELQTAGMTCSANIGGFICYSQAQVSDLISRILNNQ